MAVLKRLLPAVISCIAIINNVTAAPKLKASRSLTETMTVTAELFSTTLTTTLTFTNGGGVQLPYTPPQPSALSTYIPGHPVSLHIDGAVKRQVLVVNTALAVPAPEIAAAFVSGIAATEEAHADIQEMTLSLPISTTSKSFVLSTTIFPDPGIFGHPPPVETASTKYTATTTPNFPVVPSIMPDGTRLGQHAVHMHTTTLGASTMITTHSLFYSTELTAQPTENATSSPSNLHDEFCSPHLGGMQQHGHSGTHHSLLTTNNFCLLSDGHQEHPHTKSQGSYSFDVSTSVFSPIKLTPVYSNHTSDTLHWTTLAVICTNCELFFMTKTTRYTYSTSKTAHKTLAMAFTTTTHPTGVNMDVVMPSQIGAAFSTPIPGLFTPEADDPALPTGTPTRPHGVPPDHIQSSITVPSYGTFNTEMTTLDTSIRSKEA
ncbi:hypothetical protein VSDG_04062 [Cytospora chrysosperma]|uniref:Uncharacterized protein n=1 Tax=Cytospora chrysosperma TaxID=252740 RepID=A0A423W146_CYTCH|nr:hypothetical protein VSDG_04062 [Valsa sordida]